MAKGYWIGRVDVQNPDAYKNYVAANAAAFSKYGARFLVRGGAFEAVEGQALACWNSPEYMAAKAERDGHAVAEIIVIEGYDGPQPA